jgi:hypothetical protein
MWRCICRNEEQLKEDCQNYKVYFDIKGLFSLIEVADQL